MVQVTFEYMDNFSRGKWNKQTCCVESIGQCIEIYGLNQPDVKYKIISVDEV